ncbi:MAG: DUF2007 domain-containing protein [Bacteroides sp.]|nr:DUF2007 domain-containing protein [Bacteroides sp.]
MEKDEKTVILMTCRDSVQAHIIQGALENEGIPSILHNEHVVNLLPNMNNIMNLGVQILVFESDLERAMDILKRNQPPKVKYCPDCGSEDLSLELGKKQGRKLFFCFYVGPGRYAHGK